MPPEWGCRASCRCVIVGQANDHQVRILPFLLEFLELSDDEVRAKLVGDRHFPTDVVRGREGANRLHRRLALENDVRGLSLPGAVAGEKVGRPLPGLVAPANLRAHELAVIADRLLVGDDVVP